MSDDKHREELCPDCLAFPGEHDERVIVGWVDGSTLETWHKGDCPRRSSRPNEEPTS